MREGPGREGLALAAYVRGRRAGTLDWPPDVLWTGLVFDDDEGRALWPPRMPFGDLARIVIELESAADRLERGDNALVRQAMDDTEEGIHLRFEPSGEDAVHGSLHVIAGVVAERGEYPASLWEDENEELYTFVAEHPSARPEHWDARLLDGTALDRAWLIERLRDQARLGREAHEAAGIEFDATRFG